MKTSFLIVTICIVLPSILAAPFGWSEEDILPEEVPTTQFVQSRSSRSSAISARVHPLCTSKRLKKAGSTFACSQYHGKHRVNFHITVPKHCTAAAKCGVILNTHGQTMTAADQEKATGVGAAAKQGKKFIVIAPESPDSYWFFKCHDKHCRSRSLNWMKDLMQLAKFVGRAIRTYKTIVDHKRVHAMGFSAGATVTMYLMCMFPHVFSSGAPIGAAAGGCFAAGKAPKHSSIMFQLGKYDPAAGWAWKHSVAALKHGYGIRKGKKVKRGPGVNWTRYKAKGATVEVARYDFVSSWAGYLYGNKITIGGHCFPVKGEKKKAVPLTGGGKCGPTPHGRVAGYSYGAEAINFFEKNHHGSGKKKGKKKGKKLF